MIDYYRITYRIIIIPTTTHVIIISITTTTAVVAASTFDITTGTPPIKRLPLFQRLTMSTILPDDNNKDNDHNCFFI